MGNLINKKEKKRIDSICKMYGIENYIINPDGSIDVDEDVDLMNMQLRRLPLLFNNISGSFHCTNNKLTSLEGSPTTVRGNFSCSSNKLASLKGSPNTINGDFYCTGNELTSLNGGPMTIGGDYICSYNNLTTLEGSPTTVGGGFYCSANELISTYSGDIDLEIVGTFYLNDTIYLNDNFLPQIFLDRSDDIEILKLILKYQRHFEIWNDDLSLNDENFFVLISEIEDGLK